MQRILLIKTIPSGTVFGKVTVIGPGKPCRRTDGRAPSTSVCRCECGNIREFSNNFLKRHAPRGNLCCGCIRRARAGVCRTPTYRSWAHMNDRCSNPKSKDFYRYGGRGIAVCQRWRESYDFFLEDIGHRPSRDYSLDRFPDMNGNYEPGNVRWATKLEQANNTRTNRFIEFRGEIKTLAQWSRAFGFGAGRLRERIDRGWDLGRAMTQPRIVKRTT